VKDSDFAGKKKNVTFTRSLFCVTHEINSYRKIRRAKNAEEPFCSMSMCHAERNYSLYIQSIFSDILYNQTVITV